MKVVYRVGYSVMILTIVGYVYWLIVTPFLIINLAPFGAAIVWFALVYLFLWATAGSDSTTL